LAAAPLGSAWRCPEISSRLLVVDLWLRAMAGLSCELAEFAHESSVDPPSSSVHTQNSLDREPVAGSQRMALAWSLCQIGPRAVGKNGRNGRQVQRAPVDCGSKHLPATYA